MKHSQQVLHIHGGSPWASYEDYLNTLKTKDIQLSSGLDTSRWHYNYLNFLSEDKFDVIRLDMPCKQNAHYLEWKIWFQRHIEFLRDGVVLVGHSLGGNFLAKYLSEEDFPLSIKQLHLVAASGFSFDDDFKIKNFPGKFNTQKIEQVHIYHSTDDTVVPLGESKKYHESIPGSHLHIFNDRFHFIEKEFPELFANIAGFTN